jgi:hypothetical protein
MAACSLGAASHIGADSSWRMSRNFCGRHESVGSPHVDESAASTPCASHAAATQREHISAGTAASSFTQLRATKCSICAGLSPVAPSDILLASRNPPSSLVAPAVSKAPPSTKPYRRTLDVQKH